MTSRTLTVKLLLGILAIGAGTAMAQNSAQPNPSMQNGGMQNPGMPNGGGRGMMPGGGGMQPGNRPDGGNRPDWRNRPNNGNNFAYLPWIGGGFGPYYGDDSSGPSQSQQQQPQVVDMAPALGMAAYADTEYDNRWSSLQVLLDRSRNSFKISDDYLNAKRDLDGAQKDYDAAVETALSRLLDDPNYKDLVLKRTQEEVALKQTAMDTPIRDRVAAEKMRYGSQISQMEATALANDSDVQDTRSKLVAADEKLRLMEKRFEADLYHRPDVVAARQQMETARVNKAGADGFLTGTFITRADQLDANAQTYTGNTVYMSPWDPYYRGYYGLGIGSF
jgi:hypothetical protein